MTALNGALPAQCQRDLDSLRAFIRRAIGDGKQAAAVPVTEMEEVLLTGATGFVGRFVLRDLLRMEGNLVVHCLVRATGAEHGLQRLRAAMEEAEIWDEACAGRIRVVAGDVREARLGLSQTAFDDLAQRIDAVYHFAAEVSLSTSYSAIRRTNAFSMRNVLDLCLHTRLKHLFYASTMGVFPQYFCDFANEFAGRGIEHQGQPDPRRDEAHVPALPRRLFVEQAGRRAERVVRAPGRAARGGVSIAAHQPVDHGVYAAE